MVVDPHLDAPAELIGIEVAGDCDHRRAVEKGAAHSGRKIGRARAQGGDAQPRRPGHSPHDVGGKTGGAFMRREHEFDAALAHRLHQRQHVPRRDAESVRDAGRFQGGDDEVGIVHGV